MLKGLDENVLTIKGMLGTTSLSSFGSPTEFSGSIIKSLRGE